MNFLLDTNACIAVINGRPEVVRSRLEKALGGQSRVWVSSLVVFELWYGVGKSSQPEANARRLAAFFAGPISLLSFDNEDARVAGTLRAQLEAAGGADRRLRPSDCRPSAAPQSDLGDRERLGIPAREGASLAELGEAHLAPSGARLRVQRFLPTAYCFLPSFPCGVRTGRNEIK